MAARPAAANMNPQLSGTHRGPTARVEMITTAPRTRRNRPKKPTARANPGRAATVAAGAVSATAPARNAAGSGGLVWVGLVSGVVLMVLRSSGVGSRGSGVREDGRSGPGLSDS